MIGLDSVLYSVVSESEDTIYSPFSPISLEEARIIACRNTVAYTGRNGDAGSKGVIIRSSDDYYELIRQFDDFDTYCGVRLTGYFSLERDGFASQINPDTGEMGEPILID